MDKIEWDESLSLNVLDFDERQKEFFSYINKIIDIKNNMTRDTDPKEISEGLMMMMDFTKGYFAREEQFMAKYKYPEYEDQKRAHTEFLKTNLSFRRMIADEPENFNEDMLLYMKEWAIAHIQDHDIRFAPYLRLQLYLDEHMTTGRRR